MVMMMMISLIYSVYEIVAIFWMREREKVSERERNPYTDSVFRLSLI